MPCGSIIQLELIADSDCAKDFATFKANLHLIGKVESNWLNPAKEAIEMAFINPALTSGALGQLGNVSKEMGSHGVAFNLYGCLTVIFVLTVRGLV
jgi:hypothetical protein